MNIADFDSFAAQYEPGNSHARHTDPTTSKIAGRANFTNLKYRVCLLMARFDRDAGLTAYDIELLCKQPGVQDLFGQRPLGRSGWHRIGDCRTEGWVEVLRRPDGSVETRPGETGKPNQVYRITASGRLVALEVARSLVDKAQLT